VLHLLAIAHEAEVPLTIDDFDPISARTPVIADLKPGGRFNASTCTAPAASVFSGRGCERRASCKMPRRARALALRRERRIRETPGQTVVRSVSTPVKPRGGFAILRGSLAPEGCVLKLAGHDRQEHEGPARVFDGEEAAFEAVQAGQIRAGDVVVIRYEGPRGGPGMREMLGVTAALVGRGLGDSVALVTDGRFSGATTG
jgi:dihydroxy-acid dehydratase